MGTVRITTTITLYVDPERKGSGLRRVRDTYVPGCWVAIIRRPLHATHLALTEARTREDAERMVRDHLHIPRRRLEWHPTSVGGRAWTTTFTRDEPAVTER